MGQHLRSDKRERLMMLGVALLVILVHLPVHSANDYKVIYKQIPDNRGTEFVIGFMQQYKKEADGAIRLFITSDYNTRAVVEIPNVYYKTTIDVKARQLHSVDVSNALRMDALKIEKKGIRITADTEIVVYGLNIKKFTTDAFLALPIDIQSTKYIVPSFTPSQNSLIAIIAIYDKTTIFITFRFAKKDSHFTFKGKKYFHKDTLSVTFAESLQSLQIAHSSDMTGTRIFSTKPISVFSGNECANVPKELGFCDHLVEHIPPTNTWGQRFITAPLRGRTQGDFFRILSSNDSAEVRVNGKYVKTLSEGKFIELDVPSDQYQFIETSKPCLVVQFSKGSKVDNTNTDPFMVMIPPIEQYTAQYTVSTPDQSEKYFDSYINIVIETQRIDGLRLDGRSLRDEKWVPVWGTNHSASRLEVSHGVHRVMHDSPIVPFAIFLYGFSRADSYGYPGGLRLADLTLECVPGKPGDGLDNDCDHRIDEEIQNFIDDDNDGLIDEDLVSEPPQIQLDSQAKVLNGCPSDMKRTLKEPGIVAAPLCTSRGPFKLTFSDNVVERGCVQYISRTWFVRDGCGNLANTTQDIRILRPDIRVLFPPDVHGKCNVAGDLTVTGKPKVSGGCKGDVFSITFVDTPSLDACVVGGKMIEREWSVKASCGSAVKRIQRLFPDVTPPKITFVGRLQYQVKRDFKINWNASEESTFVCAVDNPNNPLPCGKGWFGSWSRRNIPDGKHIFWVRATDLAGNVGAYRRHPFNVDKTGPRLEFKRPLTYLSRGNFIISWRATEVSRFKCGLNPLRMEQCGSGTDGKSYLKNLQDGVYRFYVGARDELGNEANIIKHTFKIDSTPPRIKFAKGFLSNINSKVDLTILSNEFAKFSCALDDASNYKPCGEGLKANFVAKDLTEGPHIFYAKAVDTAGNVADPIFHSWNSDKTSPHILFTPGLPTKFRGTPTITWSSTEYAKFECSLDSASLSPCGRGVEAEWSKNGISDGSHSLNVRGTDKHGNVGPLANFRFLVDTRPPVVQLSKPLPKTSTTKTLTFRWTSDEMAYYRCAVDNVANSVSCGSGNNGEWTTPSLSDGVHVFFLTSKDEIGNNAPRLQHRWNIDNVLPVLRFIGTLPDRIKTNTQRFNWISTETASFKCSMDSSTVFTPCSSGTRGTRLIRDLDDGSHTFRVKAVDNHGNEGPVLTHTWKIDTDAPSVTLGEVPKRHNKPTLKFTWDSTEPSKFHCSLDDDTTGVSCGSGTDGDYLTPTLVDGEHEFRLLVEDMVGNLAPLIRSKFETDTTGPVITFDRSNPIKPEIQLSVLWQSSEESEFECSLDDPTQFQKCGSGKKGIFEKEDLPDGEHKLYVRGRDNLNNVGPTKVFTVTTDKTAPTLKFTDNAKPLSRKPAEAFTWSSDEPATFKCQVDDRDETDCGHGNNGQFITPSLPDGEHVFQVTPIDDVGNRGNSLNRQWKIDSTAPVLRYTSQPPKVSSKTVTFRWSSLESATFECALDDVANIGPCGSGTTGEKVLQELPKGRRVFWVRGTDVAGNVGSYVPHLWTVDTNPPRIQFTGDLPSSSKKSLTLHWKSDEQSEFECALDDTSFVPCGKGTQGQWTNDALPEGRHTFYVRAKDELNNIGKPIAHSWLVDSTPPRTTLSPVRPITNSPRMTLSWTANERSKFFCAIGDVGNVIECGQGTSGSWTTPFLRRGPQKFWLIAEDFNGNKGEPVVATWNIDTDAPTVTFSPESTKRSTTSTPKFSWTSDEDASFQCKIELVTQYQECGDGTSGSWTGTNVPDGKHNFLVRARDKFGNEKQPFRFQFEIDTTPPTGFSITGPPLRTNKPDTTFRWRTSENSKFACFLDEQKNPVDCGVGTDGAHTTDPLPDGDHAFTVVATDDVGNKAPIVKRRWFIDTTGPSVTFPSDLPKTTLSNPRFNWISSEPARFECSLDNSINWQQCSSGKTGAWQGINIPDGKHTLYVRGKDDLSNVGPVNSHQFQVDNQAPTIKITKRPDRSSSSPRIEWSSSEDVTFECSLDDATFTPCGKGETGSWTGNSVNDGRHKFSVQGKDVNGNTGRHTYTWTIDSNAPSVTLTGELPTTRNNPVAVFSWKSDEHAKFSCAVDDETIAVNCGYGTYGQYVTPLLPDGEHTFYITPEDLFGNKGPVAKHTWRTDSSPPQVRVNPETSVYNTLNPKFTWTSTEDGTFECAVDDTRLYRDCGKGISGTFTASNVPSGRHMFYIRGKDKANNYGPHVQYPFRVDTLAPQVSLTNSVPTKTSSPKVTFAWISSEDSRYECTLDGKLSDCGSGPNGRFTTPELPDGQHTFSLNTVDNVGNKGTPVVVIWETDTSGPLIQFPANLPNTTERNHHVTWTSSEWSTFECALDNTDHKVGCGAGTHGQWSHVNIANGPHTFFVRGRDNVNNIGDWKLYSFKVDSEAPKISFPEDQPKITKQNPTFKWTSSEHAKFKCGIDNSFNLVDCGEGTSGQWTGQDVPDGHHTFLVYGVDDMKNTGPYKQHVFTVDTNSPVIVFPQLPETTSSSPRFPWVSTENALFECSLDDADYENCGSGLEGVWTGTNLPHGKHVISVRGRDKNGNVGEPTKHTWNVDTNGPKITIREPFPPKTPNRVRSIQWTSDEIARFKCAVDEVTNIAPCGYGKLGQWVFPRVPDGKHTFYLIAQDRFGNTAPTVTRVWTVDTSAPEININGDAVYNTENPLFTWTSSEDATFECAVDDTRLYQPCGEGTSGTFTANNVPSGKHGLFIRGKDKANNYGPHVQYLFRVDTLAPQVVLTNSVPSKTNNPRATFAWTSSEDSIFECKLDGKAVECGSGVRGGLTTPKLPDGKHTFSLNTVDKVGNKGTPLGITWEIDSSAPEIHFPANLPKTTERNPQITWTSSEPSNFECALDDFNTKNVCGSGTSSQWNGVNIPKGPHLLWVRGTDSVRNVGEWKSYSFHVDSEGPKISFPEDQPRITKRDPTFKWTSSESAKFKCGIDNSFNLVDCGEGTSGQWTGQDVPDGQHTFLVYGVDDIKNRGPYKQHVFTVDSNSPVIVFSSLPVETSASPRITWRSSEDARFECSLDGGSYVDCGRGINGVWTGNNLRHGKHVLSVRGSDRNDNVGEPTKHTWNVDTNAPKVSIDQFPIITKDPILTIQWTSDENAKFKCAVNNPKNVVNCGYGKDGLWTTPRMPDGEHTFFLTAEDTLGNTGPSLSRKWKIDSTPPQVKVNPDKSVYNSVEPLFTWTSSEDATFECAIDNTRFYKDCGRGMAGTFTANNVPNGKHMFYVRGMDRMTNFGPHVQYPFEIDTQASRIFLTESVPPKTKDPRGTFAWTSSEDSKFECQLDGKSVECGRGLFGRYTTPELPDGKHTFTLNTVDNVGNKGTPEVVDWEIDSIAPEIQLPANLPSKTKGHPQVTWTGSEPSNFECAVDYVQSKTSCGSGTSGQWNLVNILNGPHTFMVRGTDAMKNIGDWKYYKFVVDTEGPKISFPDDQPKITKQNPTFKWTSSEPAKFKCGIDRNYNLVDCGEGTSGQWTGQDVPDGHHTFLVYGVDDMKNTGPLSRHVFTVDNNAPVITFLDVSDVTSSSPRFSWTSSEDARFECSLDGGNYEDCGNGRDGVWTGTNLRHGKHVFSVRGEDTNGNVGEPTNHTWNVDTNAPIVSIKEPFPNKTSIPALTVRWTSDEEAKFYCAVDDVKKATLCGYGKEGQWVTPRLPDGEHTFYLTPEDKLGNKGPTVNRKWSIDTRYPTLTFSADLRRTTGSNPTLTWTSSEDATFECVVDDFGTTFECGSAGVSGSWTGQNMTDGRHLLWVRGTDNAGNTGPFISHSWIVDDSAPRLRFIGALPKLARRLPMFRWVSNELSTFECSLDSLNYGRCGKGIIGSWRRLEIRYGRHVFRVRGRDDQGNVGETISHVIIIDTIPPEIKLLNPLPSKSKESTATFTWKSNEIARFTCAVDVLKTRVDCGRGKSGRFTTEFLTDGDHVFYLLGEDDLGNAARVVTHRWIVDKTKPQVEFLPNQPKISDSDITILWKTITNTISKFECSLDNGFVLKSCGAGKTGSWTGRNIPDGQHKLYVRARDSFGNAGDIKIHSWRVDTKVPIVKLIGMPPKRSTYDTGSFIWTSDEMANFVCAIDVVENGEPCGKGNGNSWVTSKLAESEHTFYLFATDINGNKAEPIQYTWIIDSKPPTLTLDGDLPLITGGNVTLKWKSDEDATYQCAVDNIFDNRDCGIGKAGQLRLTNLPDGYHTVWIKAVDKLGNTAPWVKHSWIVDSRPPELKFISELPTKTNGSITLLWRTGEESTFQCRLDDGQFFNCGDALDGRWTTRNLPDGIHRFIVKATDMFGNIGAMIEHTWTIDTKPPVLRFTSKGPMVSGKKGTFVWVSDEWARFFCAHENINDMQPCGEGEGSKWIEDDLPEGKHRFWVIGIDVVGNRAEPLNHDWIVDTKGPTIFFNEPVPKKSGRSVQFSWRSNEKASFFCAFDNPENYFSCGEGFESDIRSDNLKRNGKHRIFIKGVDEHGNEGDPTSTTWIVDLVAPVLIEVGPLPRLTNQNPIITWRVNEVAVFECALDDLNKFKWCGNGTKGRYEGHDVDKGEHTLFVKVKDGAGNEKTIINHTFVVGIPDNRGREFILGFLQQYNKKRAGSVSLFITSDNDTVAKITIPGLNFRRTIHLQEDELVRVNLPLGTRMSGTRKENKGILVTADHELVVYGLNIMPHTTDAYLALPTDIQGMEYYAVSYTVSQHSLIGIVGIEDNTIVYLTVKMQEDTPIMYNGAVYRDGDTLIIRINRLQTFQLAHVTDLTGTRITSTKVISVYSGNECANVPEDKGYCDHLVEMLTPTSTWGRRFVTAPLYSRKSGDYFRIVASEDNTDVVVHPGNRVTIHAGEYVELDVRSDEYQFITASRPCILMQYSKGADTDNTNTDPFMIMIPPIEQYGSHYILSTPDRARQQYFQSYINVIILSEHIYGVQVDGKPAFHTNIFVRIKGTPYSAAAINVTKGVHRVDHTSPIVTFGAFMYGYAWRDSYGYPGGLRLADITGECTGVVDTPADGMDNDCDRRIDEELMNGIDDDGDGRIDEDLATFPPVIQLSQTYYEYQSCTLEVDALVPRAKAIGSAECELKGALRLRHRDHIDEGECTRLINRTWEAADGCGNIVALKQVIKITKPHLLITFPVHVPNGCNGPTDLSDTGAPQIESICGQEQVRVSYRDNISVKECQEKGLLLERRFTVNELCGREYTGLQRIYPGAAN